MARQRVVEEIPIALIDWTENERSSIDPEKLAAVTASVREHGVLQPITVTHGDRGRFNGLSGATRLAAVRAAGLTTIPAIVRDAPASAANATALRMTENLVRSDLPPMDVSIGLQKLIAAGLTAADISKQVSLSASEVSKSLSLGRLPKRIQDEIRNGRISASAGYALSQIEDAAEQAAMAARVAAGEVTRDQLAGVARRSKKGTATQAPATGGGRVAAALGDGRTVVFGGPGLDTMDGLIRCLEDLLARARKARPQGIEVRTFAKMLRDQSKQSNPAG